MTTQSSDLRPSRDMPGVYSDAVAEYAAVTSGAAIFDASGNGRLKATGADALDLLNRLSTNEVIDLQPGQGAPTILTTDRGRILDLITVLKTGAHALLLTSPGAQQSVVEWLDKYTIMEDLTVEDVSGATAMVGVWGPGARATLEAAAGFSLAELPLYSSVETLVGGETALLVSAQLPAWPGYHVICSADAAPGIWRAVTKAGALPIGEEAYEASRVDAGVPALGREMGDDYNPLEAGLIGCIDFAKGCYIGQEVIARLDTYHKVQKYLVKLAFDPGVSVNQGTTLVQEGRVVGRVTSSAIIPTNGETVALAYVRAKNAVPGAALDLEPPAVGQARIEGLSQLFGPGEE